MQTAAYNNKYRKFCLTSH